MRSVSSARSSRKSFCLGLAAGCVIATLAFEVLGGFRCLGLSGIVFSKTLAPQPICLNTCYKARDGVCDEGRFPPGPPALINGSKIDEIEVHCELGSDCDDCGAFLGAPHTKSWTANVAPVSFSKSRDVRMFVSQTLTEPPFYFTYTDWEVDDDVSRFLHYHRQLEGGIGKVFKDVLESRCVRQDGKRALFVDVGANFGYFSIYAAKLGCRVVAWEPIPQFRAFFEHSIAINNVSHLISVRTRAISAELKGKRVTMKVPLKGNWGTASIEGMNTADATAFEWVETSGEAIDDVIDEPVLLMKVDVEGHEVAAMESAARLMSMHGVDNIVLEYNPHVAEASNDSALLSKNIGMIKGFLTSGYRIAHLDGDFAKRNFGSEPMPALKEVSLKNLQYDEEDLRQGCTTNYPAIANLSKRFLSWRYWTARPCLQRAPTFSHPKSFRVSFYANTNIWAQREEFEDHRAVSSLDPQLVGKMNLTGSVGHLEFDEDARKTWISKKYMDTGLAGIPCSIVEKSNLVLWRCKCSNMTKCGAEEMEVIDLLAEGKFQHLYEL